MKTHVEALSSVQRKLTVDLPVERVAEALEQAFQKVQKTAKLKGFRQGKVPRHLIEQYYPTEMETSAIEHLVRSTYPDATTGASLVPISQPRIEPGPFQKDQPFTYAAIVEVRPVVQLGAYTKLSLSRTEYTVSAEEVEAQLQAAQQSMTQLVPVDDAAVLEQGMVARVDFDGLADGKGFEGSKAQDYVIDVGGGNLLPVFEAQTIGMKVGETRDIEFTYPEDYFNVTLAGAKGTFHVVLKELKRKMVPELTDDFAKDLGNFQSLAEVRAEIRQRLEGGKERQARSELAEQAMKHLLAQHPFDVPETMVGWELESMYRDLERRAKAEKKTLADLGITPEGFVQQYEAIAKDRVRGNLILDAISEAEKLAVAEAEVDTRIQEIAQSMNEPSPKVRLYYEQNKLLPALQHQLLHEKALDFIIGTSKIRIEKVKSGEKKAK